MGQFNVTLEKPIYENLKRMAKRDGVSLSLKLRDLIMEAMEIEEDNALAGIAEGREKTFDKSSALKHDQVW